MQLYIRGHQAALLLARLPAACLTAVRVGRDFIRVIVEADEVWSLEYQSLNKVGELILAGLNNEKSLDYWRGFCRIKRGQKIIPLWFGLRNYPV